MICCDVDVDVDNVNVDVDVDVVDKWVGIREVGSECCGSTSTYTYVRR